MASSQRRGSDEMPVCRDNIFALTLKFPTGRKCKTPADRSRIERSWNPVEHHPDGGNSSGRMSRGASKLSRLSGRAVLFLRAQVRSEQCHK